MKVILLVVLIASVIFVAQARQGQYGSERNFVRTHRRETRRQVEQVMADSEGPYCDQCQATCDNVPAAYPQIRDQCRNACKTVCDRNLSDTEGQYCDQCQSTCDRVPAAYPQVREQCKNACKTVCDRGLADSEIPCSHCKALSGSSYDRCRSACSMADEEIEVESDGQYCDQCQSTCDRVPAAYPQIRDQCKNACKTVCDRGLADSEIPCAHCKVFSGSSYDRCRSTCSMADEEIEVESDGQYCDQCNSACDRVPAAYPQIRDQCRNSCKTVCDRNLSDSESEGQYCDQCNSTCDRVPAAYPQIRDQCKNACKTVCDRGLADSEIACFNCNTLSGSSYARCRSTCR